MNESSPPPPVFDQVARHPSGWEAVRCSSLDSMRTQNVLFWQRQGGAAIRQAAWELVVEAWKAQNRDPDELRSRMNRKDFRFTTSPSPTWSTPKLWQADLRISRILQKSTGPIREAFNVKKL